MPTPLDPFLRATWGHSPFFRAGVNRITSELISLLEPDHDRQAGVMRKLRDAVASGDLSKAKEQFSSGDIWGGAGSVSDVSFTNAKANRRHCKLLLQLVRSFARAGIRYAPASDMARIYKSWIRQGVFAS